MGIYIVNIILIAMLAILFIGRIQNDRIKKCITIVIFFQLFILSSLRKIGVGVDMPVYIEQFNIIRNIEFKNLYLIDWDLGYVYLNKIISMFTENEYIFQAVIALIILGLISIYIYKYSKNIIMSYYVFIGLGYFNMSFNLIRQMIAMGIVTISYKYLVNKKSKKFFLFMIVAILFHSSAIFFIPIYFIINKEINIRHYINMFMLCICTYLFSGKLISLFIRVYRNDYSYLDIEQGGYSLLGMYLVILIFFIIFKSDIRNKNEGYEKNYNIIFLLVITQIMATKFSLFTRVSNYFAIFLVVLIPNVLDSIEDKKIRVIMNIFIYICIFIYYLYSLNIDLGGTYYYFWWQ